MRLAVVLLATLTALAGGCGGSTLTEDEHLDIAQARVHFAGVVLDGRDYAESLASIDRVIAIYRAKPDATYDPDADKDGDDLTMRQVVEDAASDLDGYQPDMAAELDRALAPR